MPRRFQLKRTKGCRLPPNTVGVAPPRRYGNPDTMRNGSREERRRCVAAYRTYLLEGHLPYSEDELERELPGVNVACCLPEDKECHGDMVLETANR